MPDVLIGLECHVSLNCDSKLFCSCPTRPSEAAADEPNTRVCPICLGFPGSKPVLNKKAVDFGIIVALALNCRVNKEFFFSRKTYFYPDLAKDFQITQYEIPVGENGFVEVEGKKIRIRRVHIEEDPAALVHEAGMGGSKYCLVDYNRSGIPLVEIVTEPDIESPLHARHFLDKLLTVLNYLGVYAHGESVLKADCNLSINGGERVEVKNVTGFRAVEDALRAEFERQKKLVAGGGKIVRETRGFDAVTKSTFSMRTKETEDDYGYIADGDLVKTEVDEAWLSSLRAKLPELAEEKAKRLIGQYRLNEYDAKVIAGDKAIADIFEECAKADASIAARIVSRELLGILSYNSLRLGDTKVTAKGVAGLVLLMKDGKVSGKNAKESLIRYCLEGTEPGDFLSNNGLLIDSSGSGIEDAVNAVVAENPAAFADFRSGNQKSLNFLIGIVMRKLKGKANAREIQAIIEGLK
ncbi:Aspartyl/glutamyl-tRNA(Asn/Gln) amidotransferase subunit B [uncultured archaeon]|nr:Aspartyl/glutamyl-tRNA(Asn/Gln) amidotransferase subunit B [uncultured archaeon]